MTISSKLRYTTVMDKLEQIFGMQFELDEYMRVKRGLDKLGKEEWIRKKTLAMISELAELIDEVNFKWWKAPKVDNEAAIKGELVDILHFFVSMCLDAGLNAEELFELYKAKNVENVKRQKGTSVEKDYSK